MTKSDYTKEYAQLEAEYNRIKEERDFFKRGCRNIRAEYNRTVQKCTRMEMEITASQRKKADAEKQPER